MSLPTAIVSWLKLVRVFNVPIVLAAMFAGALVASEHLTPLQYMLLSFFALISTAAVQSFNDYEDRHADAVNAKFRPIPSGLFTADSVLLNGYVCASLSCLLSAPISLEASITMMAMMLLTRWYSALKKYSLIHHLMLPAALGLTSLYGALLVSPSAGASLAAFGSLPTTIYYVAVSIFLIDINMNIVGAFKDLFEGSEEEFVLPVIFGKRPAIIVSGVLGTIGILMQGIPVFTTEDVTKEPLLPLTLGLVVHCYSRIKLYLNPTAEQGYKALKAGRAVEVLCFPAMMFGARPPAEATLILVLLVGSALVLQAYIKEAELPTTEKPASTSVTREGECLSDSSIRTAASDEEGQYPLLDLLYEHPCQAELFTVGVCVLITLFAFFMAPTNSGCLWIRLYIPLFCCAVGVVSVIHASQQQHLSGLLKNDWAYIQRYMFVIFLALTLDVLIHYAFTTEFDTIALSNWAALIASASVIVPIGSIWAGYVNPEYLQINVVTGVCILVLQVFQAVVSVLGAQSWQEVVVLLLARRVLIVIVVHVISGISYSNEAASMLRNCRTLEYVAHHAVATGRDVILDTPQCIVIGGTLLKTPILGGENMMSGKASWMRVVDKIILTEQILACSSPTILCHSPTAICHLSFMYEMFQSHDIHLNPELQDPSLCLSKVTHFLQRRYSKFASTSTLVDGAVVDEGTHLLQTKLAMDV
ncbi:Prenyltransferase [Seminavis robusta]|uniref:Prenyltransferase n=1 Tax=Seminavis robusta TaxID=568900 RepID=A0A9N8DZK0_9STRA|nr:Prenyltransferase [Seminavis robusta]|eukprot:Sro366_g127560.1 Prenyltransferase (702) ;mRNA; r:16516-18621